jgi:transposase
MPRNEVDRAKYEVTRERYSSGMSDTEFALIRPLLLSPKRRGRKPTDPRDILNALFYLIRSGCLWRLSSNEFPPYTTVENRLYAWRDSGLWTQQIVCLLVMAAREAEGREATPWEIPLWRVATSSWGSVQETGRAKRRVDRKGHLMPDRVHEDSHPAKIRGLSIRWICQGQEHEQQQDAHLEQLELWR